MLEWNDLLTDIQQRPRKANPLSAYGRTHGNAATCSNMATLFIARITGGGTRLERSFFPPYSRVVHCETRECSSLEEKKERKITMESAMDGNL